jgi:hypothetical protein
MLEEVKDASCLVFLKKKKMGSALASSFLTICIVDDKTSGCICH